MSDKANVPWITKDQWKETFRASLRDVLRKTVSADELEAAVERRLAEAFGDQNGR